MNAYGPSFWNITPNKVVFQNAVVHHWFDLQIDLKLANNVLATQANVFGVTVKGEPYENVGSQIPALFLQPNSMNLEVCMQVDNDTVCESSAVAVTPDEWFSLWFEQWCWVDLDGEDWCSFYVLKTIDGLDGWEVLWYWWNETPITFENVEGVIGNTYGDQNFAVAVGDYKNFRLDQYETRSAPSANLNALIDAANIDQTAAANA